MNAALDKYVIPSKITAVSILLFLNASLSIVVTSYILSSIWIYAGTIIVVSDNRYDLIVAVVPDTVYSNTVLSINAISAVRLIFLSYVYLISSPGLNVSSSDVQLIASKLVAYETGIIVDKSDKNS